MVRPSTGRLLSLLAIAALFVTGCDSAGDPYGSRANVDRPPCEPDEPGCHGGGSGGGGGTGSSDTFGPFTRLAYDAHGTARSCPSNGIASAYRVPLGDVGSGDDFSRHYSSSNVAINGTSYSARLAISHEAYKTGLNSEGTNDRFRANTFTQIQIYCNGEWRVPKHSLFYNSGTYAYNETSTVKVDTNISNGQTFEGSAAANSDSWDELSAKAAGLNRVGHILESKHTITYNGTTITKNVRGCQYATGGRNCDDYYESPTYV